MFHDGRTMVTQNKPRSRNVMKVLVAVPVFAFLLSGCLNVEADLELKSTNSGGEISGTTFQYINLQAFESFGDLFGESFSESFDMGGSGMANDDMFSFDDGGTSTYSYSYENSASFTAEPPDGIELSEENSNQYENLPDVGVLNEEGEVPDFTINEEWETYSNGDGAEDQNSQNPGLFELSEEEREEFEANAEEVKRSLSQPDTVSFELVTTENEIGVKVTYSSTTLEDYQKVSEALNEETGDVSGSGFTSSDQTQNVNFFPQFEEKDEGYKVKMLNPFYVPAGGDEYELEGFSDALSPQYDVSIALPAVVKDTNTPDAADGKMVMWDSEALKNASNEEYVYAVSGKGSSTFPVIGVALLLLLLIVVLGVALLAFINLGGKKADNGEAVDGATSNDDATGNDS